MELLAPNGGYSKLTPEQYKLVRTPAFKSWFGDWETAYETKNYDNVSKVIGYNMKGFSGEPIICSHISYDKFNVFRTPSFFQEGEDGGAYGDSSDEELVNYNVFLSIKNPLELRGAVLRDKFIPLISEIFKNAGISEEDFNSRIEFAEKYSDAWGLFKLFEKPYWKGEYGYYWEWIFDYCKKNNYDGFVMNDSDKTISYTITTWVALENNQIKLADGTNTTFDSNNPDIRFDDGGNIEEVKNYLKNIRVDKDYMESVTDLDIVQYQSDFGRKGTLTWRAYPEWGKDGLSDKVSGSIYISSIDRGTGGENYDFVSSIEGKKDSRGEGAIALASLFLRYPLVHSVHYEDESGFEDELGYYKISFWQKIGGDESELMREDFFNYFTKKFGYNPDSNTQNLLERYKLLEELIAEEIKEKPKNLSYYKQLVALKEKRKKYIESINPDIRFGGGGEVGLSSEVIGDRKEDVYSIGKSYADVTKYDNNWGISYTESDKKGDGTKIMNRIIDDAKKQNVSQITLQTGNGSETFFMKFGFQVTEEDNGYFYMKWSNPDIRFDKGGLTMKKPKQLLAPNGQPSNLAPEQYRLVRTPAFKSWFGDWENSPETASKIIDDNGEPLICFHGSNNEFNVFEEKYLGSSNDMGFYGRGFYFTFQKDEKYMKFANEEAGYYGKVIKSYFIKALNPFIFGELKKYKGVNISLYGTQSLVFLNNIAKTFPQLAEIITLNKTVYNSFNKEENEVIQVSISVLPDLIDKYSKDLKIIEVEDRGEIKINGYLKSKTKEVFYDSTESGGTKGSYLDFETLSYGIDSRNKKEEIEILLIEAALEKYDGIEVKYNPEGYMTRYPEITEEIKKNHDCIMQGETGDELVVFENNRMKLADGSNTTFDGRNPDVRFDNGGLITTDNIKVEGLSHYQKTKKSGEFYRIFAKKIINDNEHELWWILFTIKDGKKTLGHIRYRYENIEKDVYNENQISLSDLPKSLLDIYNKYGRNNPNIMFAKGGLTMKKPKESDYSGEYGDLHQFIFDNDLQQVFADKYEINVDDWEDYAYGDFGTDEEVIEELIGKGYKIFYNESDDEFVITKKKTGKLEYKIIALYNKKYHKDVLDVIEKSGIYSEYEPEFAVIVGKNVVGGATSFIDEDNVYNFDIGILDKYQGYGISKELIEKIITAAKEDIGVKAIKAYVVNDMLFRYLGEIGFSLSRDLGEQYAYMPIKKKKKKYEFGGLTIRKPKIMFKRIHK